MSPKRRSATSLLQLAPSLPFDGATVVAPEPSTLSLVETAPPESSALDSQNSQTRKVTSFPRPNTGLPNSQSRKPLPQFDASEEARYPSRVTKRRVQPRLDRNLLQKVEVECAGNLPKPLDLQEAFEDGLKLWLRARAQSRLDSQNSQTPTGFSGGSGLENNDLTTTTTTVGSQPHKARLPGVASAIADFRNQPHESRHDIEVNLAYAWESNRKGEGINAPDVWAASNYRTGKHDALIDLWVERKRLEEETAKRAAAARAERDERDRQETARMMEEMRIRDEEQTRAQADEAARKEAEREQREEQGRRARAELDRKFDEGLAQGKKPWEIT